MWLCCANRFIPNNELISPTHIQTVWLDSPADASHIMKLPWDMQCCDNKDCGYMFDDGDRITLATKSNNLRLKELTKADAFITCYNRNKTADS